MPNSPQPKIPRWPSETWRVTPPHTPPHTPPTSIRAARRDMKVVLEDQEEGGGSENIVRQEEAMLFSFDGLTQTVFFSETVSFLEWVSYIRSFLQEILTKKGISEAEAEALFRDSGLVSEEDPRKNEVFLSPQDQKHWFNSILTNLQILFKALTIDETTLMQNEDKAALISGTLEQIKATMTSLKTSK